MSRKFWTPGNIVGLLILLPIVGMFLSFGEHWYTVRNERAAIRPGMDLAEVFTVARNWTWAWAYTGQGEQAPFQITAFDGARASFGEEYYDDWESFLAAVRKRHDELLPYPRWVLTYNEGLTPLKSSFSIILEDGKVTRVGEARSWD